MLPRRMRKPLLLVLLLLVHSPAAAATPLKTIRSARPGYYGAETRFPQFSERTPLTRLANATFSHWARTAQRDFIHGSQATFQRVGKPAAPCYYKARPTITYYAAPRLISVRFDVSEYTGGAHGLFVYVPFNFGFIGGRAKRLSLADLFTSGTEDQRRVSDRVIRKLKQNPRALWVINGQMTRLTPLQLNSFSIEPDGLTFLLNSYEAGPYSSGTFQVKLTLDELGPHFKQALLHRRSARLPVPHRGPVRAVFASQSSPSAFSQFLPGPLRTIGSQNSLEPMAMHGHPARPRESRAAPHAPAASPREVLDLVRWGASPGARKEIIE